jgi:hypothetical protein
MAAPILLLGLAVAGGLAFLGRASKEPEREHTNDLALIDASEKTAPGAELARKAIRNAMNVNSMTLYEMTAVAIENQLKMPKTAMNMRSWADVAKQGGSTIAGDDDDEVGGSEGYGDDEVGARRRRKKRVKKLYAKAAAEGTTTAEPAQLGESSSSYGPAPLVNWSASDDEDEEDEIGARRRRGAVKRSAGKRPLPDWLKFAATQSKLAGDPKLIKATAVLLGRMGYAEHAKIHLQESLG